jgi:ribokinase
LPPRPWLTVVGSINLDFVTQCERLPKPGETVTGAEFTLVPGGKGANQALAAKRLGAYVDIIGCIGEDWMANQALQYLTAERVDLDISVAKHGEPTGVAVILVDREGENQIVVAPGANLLVMPEQIGFPEHAVLCQLEIPIETVAAAAERAQGFFCVNAAPATRVPAEVLGRADLVVVNRYELDALAEMPRVVALTLGAEGAAILEDGEEVLRAVPPRVDAVDGTAAGDAFTACLVVSLLEGRDREEALRRACAAGAIAASRPGAQPSLPTADEVDAILRA